MNGPHAPGRARRDAAVVASAVRTPYPVPRVICPAPSSPPRGAGVEDARARRSAALQRPRAGGGGRGRAGSPPGTRHADSAPPGGGAELVRLLFVNAIVFVGGAEKWIVQLTRRLVPRGHEIQVAYDPRSPLGELARAAGAQAWVPRGAFRGARLGRVLAARSACEIDVVCPPPDDLKIAGSRWISGHPGVFAASTAAESGRSIVVGLARRRHRGYHRSSPARRGEQPRGKRPRGPRLPPPRVSFRLHWATSRASIRAASSGAPSVRVGIPASAPLAVSISRTWARVRSSRSGGGC